MGSHAYEGETPLADPQFKNHHYVKAGTLRDHIASCQRNADMTGAAHMLHLHAFETPCRNNSHLAVTADMERYEALHR